jgi:hypothetical protein
LAPAATIFDGLLGQEAHLADAAFGMGVTGQAVIHQQPGLVHVVLDHALAVADGDRVDAAGRDFLAGFGLHIL